MKMESSFQMFTAHVPQAMKKHMKKSCPILLCHCIFFSPYPSIFFLPSYLGKVQLSLDWSHHLGWSFKILGSQEKPISALSCTSEIGFGSVRAVTLRLELIQEVMSELYLLYSCMKQEQHLCSNYLCSNIPGFEERLLFRILSFQNLQSALVGLARDSLGHQKNLSFPPEVSCNKFMTVLAALPGPCFSTI